MNRRQFVDQFTDYFVNGIEHDVTAEDVAEAMLELCRGNAQLANHLFACWNKLTPAENFAVRCDIDETAVTSFCTHVWDTYTGDKK